MHPRHPTSASPLSSPESDRPIRLVKIKPTPPLDTQWRFRWLLVAPHRLAFFGAAVMLASSALWWCVQLFAQTLAAPVSGAVSPSTAHAMLMGLGFMPLFFAGFLFTAGPKWLAMPEVPARSLLPQVIAWLLGWSICLAGFHVSSPLVAAGMALVALAWTQLAWKFSCLWHASRVVDKTHAGVVVVASGMGVLALWTIVVGLAGGHDTLVRAATQAALWMFIATVVAAVSHRMIPFFDSRTLPMLDAWRPLWLLWTLVGLLWLEGIFAALNLWLWPTPAGLRWLQVAVEAPAAALMLWLAIRWGLAHSLKIRMLAMLFGGFVWLGIALALFAVSHTLMALSGDQVSLGLAPLHAMTMGYLGATLFAMATRVSAGHSGRSQAADNTAWALYWVAQLAVLLRVVSALRPDAGTVPLLAAISVWTVACCGWAVRYGSWFGRPRADGRPG